ncbi:procathepsin L-like [Diorhabda carinulata]|uniref:procathepsin L-like n=1 Tax=Diorhabda carinulata TaxID=1163345 RepID=UPI0025A2FB3F|nr:procathepsin L-like [Diorhabda carinulata]
MKILLVIPLIIVATYGLSAKKQWDSFKIKYEKSFESYLEERLRFQIFKSNLKRIREHNANYDKGESSYYMGVTKFADMTQDEFKNMLDKQISVKPMINTKSKDFSGITAPESVDWRTTGAVLAVKDQGTCGACWSFSSTGALEGQNFLKNNISIPLSEQELIDCSNLYNNNGCYGGSMKYAFDYVLDHGVSSEESYPYIAEADRCHRNSSNIVLYAKNVVAIADPTIDKLKSAVASVGPISVPVSADVALQLYKGGIFDETDCSNAAPNHAVLLVGYGNENGKDYWIIKNSWGTKWGENGFYRLQTNPVICAILNGPVYPEV